MVDKFFQIQRDIHAKREKERIAREALVEMKKEKLFIKRTLVSYSKYFIDRMTNLTNCVH